MNPRHNLPPRDYERFVGRQSELAELRRLLGSRSRAFVITIDGVGGIGKSALALEAAYSLCNAYEVLAEAERFEAIVWVSAKRTYLTTEGIVERRQTFRALNDLFTAIAEVLDFPAITRARAEEQLGIVEQVLAEQRTLLLIDNLETVDDEGLLHFLRELPAPTKAIVTTRHRIDVAHPLRLTGMPHEDALTLIDQEATRKGALLTTKQREQLWTRTGGMPLAIVWSIGLIGSGLPVEEVVRRLGQGQSDIVLFCFAESVEHLHERDPYWLLLALGLFATDASREALGVVAGLGDDTFGRDRGLEELLRLSLINKDGDRFSLLPLTRSFVQNELAKSPELMKQALPRLYDYFNVLTRDKGGWSKDWEGQELIERELPNLLAIIDDLFAGLRYQDAPRQHQLEPDSVPLARLLCKIVPRVARTCRLRGHWSVSETLCLQAITVREAAFLVHPRGFLETHRYGFLMP
jgi:LuxR family glucitol operon transcriptional activator